MIDSDHPVPSLAEFMLGAHVFINLICARSVKFAHSIENSPEHELLSEAKPIVCVLEICTSPPDSWHIIQGFGRTPEEAFADAWQSGRRMMPRPELLETSGLYEEFTSRA